MWELDQIRIRICRGQVSADPCWRWLCLCDGHSWWEDLWDGRPRVQGATKTIFSHISVSSLTFNVRSPISPPPKHMFGHLVFFFWRFKNPFCACEGIEYHMAIWGNIQQLTLNKTRCCHQTNWRTWLTGQWGQPQGWRGVWGWLVAHLDCLCIYHWLSALIIKIYFYLLRLISTVSVSFQQKNG